MDPISSAGQSENRDAEKKVHRRKVRLLIFSIAFITFLFIFGKSTKAISKSFSSKSPNSENGFIRSVCSVTLYPESCYSSISSARQNTTVDDTIEMVFKSSVEVALNAVFMHSAMSFSEYLSAGAASDKAALRDCKELFDSAVVHLNESLAIYEEATILNDIIDIQTVLSAAVADISTCTESLAATQAAAIMAEVTVDATEYTSNSLAIATRYEIKSTRVISSKNQEPLFASRKLLPLLNSAEGKMKANVTVAKDGTGEFESIGAAMEKVPEKSLNPFVIYVKEGVYEEYVVVARSKWNVVMVGDGMNRTIVTGSRNTIDGSTAYKSATFTVEGRGFIAVDMAFKNTAGPQKGQAAALLSKSDRSIFLRCSFHAFHNTLYPHSLYANSISTATSSAPSISSSATPPSSSRTAP